MSQVQSNLDILINVLNPTGMEPLTKGQVAVKQLLGAQAALDEQRGNSKAALADLMKLEDQFSQSITNQARKTLELIQIERQQLAVEQSRQAAVRQALVQSAELSASKGNLARAEEKLQAALQLSDRGSAEAFRIRQRLVAIDQQRAAASEAARAATVQEALTQASLAKAMGDTSGQIARLTQLSQSAMLTDRERVTVLNQLTSAQARQAAEVQAAQKAQASANATTKEGFSATGALGAAFSKVLAAIGTAVLLGFAIRSVFRGLDSVIVDPIQNAAKSVLEATDKFRQLDASLIGVAGSLRGVRDLTADVAKASTGLPLTRLEAITAVRGLAFTPGTAELLQAPSEDRIRNINNLLKVVNGLATINPQQGIEGAQFSIREALAGQLRSLQTRFDVSPGVIAAGIGKTAGDLRADPNLVIPALSKFVDTFLGPDAIDQFNKLLSTQAKRLRGAMEEFFALIGDSGFYDHVVDVITKATNFLERAVRPDANGNVALGTTAGLISNSLTGVVDQVLISVGQAISRTTGQRVDLRNLTNEDPEKLGIAIANIIDMLGTLAAAMVAIVPKIAGAILRFSGLPESREDARRTLDQLQNESTRRAAEIALNQKAFETGKGPTTGGPGLIGGLIASFTSSEGYTPDDIRGFAGERLQTLREQQEEADSTIELLKLRLGIFDKGNTAIAPRAKTIGEVLAGNRSSFQIFQSEIGKTLGGFGAEKTDDKTLKEIDDLGKRIDKLFDPKAGFPGLVARSNAALDDVQSKIQALSPFVGLSGPVGSALGGVNRALVGGFLRQSALQSQVGSGIGSDIAEAIANIIERSPKDLAKFDSNARVVGSTDVLSVLFSSLGGGNLRESLGNPSVLGQQGLFGNRLNGLISAAAGGGVDVPLDQIFRPDLLKETAELIDEIGQGILKHTGNYEKADQTVQNLVTSFHELVDAQIASGKLPPEVAEGFRSYIGFLDDTSDKYTKLVNDYRDGKLAELAANDAKSLAEFVGAVTQSVTDNVARVKKELQSLKDVQKTGELSVLLPFTKLPQASTQERSISQQLFNFGEGFSQITNDSQPGSPGFFINSLTERVKDLQEQLENARYAMRQLDDVAASAKPGELREKRSAIQKAIDDFNAELEETYKLQAEQLKRGQETVSRSFRGIIQGAPGALQNVASFRQGDTTPRLESIRRFFDFAINQPPSLNAEASGGVLGDNLIGLKPEDVDALSASIDLMATEFDRLGKHGSDAKGELNGIVDALMAYYQAMRDNASEDQLAIWDEAIAKLEETKRRINELPPDVKKAFQELSAQATEAIKVGLVDSIIDLMNEGGRNIEAIGRRLVLSIQKSVTEAAVQILFINTLVKPLMASIIPTGGLNLFGKRTGDVFANGMVSGFASGAIFDYGAVTFPMSNGRTGALGEDGPEAVVPLYRGPDNKLGLAQMGGGRSSPIVNIYVQSPNADSFNRSSRQIAEKMHAAIAR